jgi:hypothetical protein
MKGQGLIRIVVLPLLDAMALGSVFGALILSAIPRSNRLGTYEDAKIFLTFAASAALAVFVVEIVVHTIVRSSAEGSGARRGGLQGAPVERRGQRIRRILLLPLVDAITLGLIVGALVIYIDTQHNASIYESILAGEGNLARPVKLFLVYWVPIVIIVLVVEPVIHQIVRAIEWRGLLRART